MEWYREQTIQLIDLFRARPALWDTSSVHYRNKRMKNEALEQISAKLKCPKEEIAKKICTLRVQFSRENVKVKRARESGTVYNPKWFGYQLLCFLNDQSRYTSQPINSYSTGCASSAAVGASGSTTSSAATQNQADVENPNFQWNHKSEDSYAEVNDTNASGYEADSVLASMMHEQESIDYYHNQEPIIDVQEHQTWLSNRKYRGMLRGAGSDYSDDDGGGTLSSRKVMRMSRPDTVFDEFSTFSDYVAERMRNLKADKALQLMARRDIEQVLFKYEMKLLEQNRDLQQQQQPDTEAATTSKSISPSPISDSEQP
ncbi:MADF domain [Cinara cedri]|uniref:MADF domain n=1 Tax=Cinara cedri TaxID=506608 RepID=A0A5E4MFF1_9HEMI|nr:MADF domain [Cinara cedri]